MAKMKNGSMVKIMMRVAALDVMAVFRMKKGGIPSATPLPKQINWRLVRLNMTLVLMRDKSFGTGINGIYLLWIVIMTSVDYLRMVK